MTNSIKVNDHILLEKRERSPNWYAAIKHPETRKWKKLSTGTTDETKAKEFAIEKHFEWRILQKQGISTVKKESFEAVAQKYLKRLKG
ncbi:MAG: hypothetical protein O3A85_11135, partial [Proteobacteria bacterium]|nr:hypothetical protein [Pseudomonadota bacterium]